MNKKLLVVAVIIIVAYIIYKRSKAVIQNTTATDLDSVINAANP